MTCLVPMFCFATIRAERLSLFVGAEANGMTLSVVSVFARLGNDPWQEASRLALLPMLEATESLDGALQGCR
jgi:hypothetical protein